MVLAASTDPFSAEHTGAVLAFVLTSIFGTISSEHFALIHFLVRKSAHVTEYGILAVLFFRAWRGDRFSSWQFSWARQAWAICIAVAATDELHQSFVASRGSSPWDVALDATGAAVVLAIVWLHWKWIARARVSKSASPAKQPASG